MPPRSARRMRAASPARSGSSAAPPTATAHFFGSDKGMGTMPHALIGYAGSTVRAAEMFRETFPDEPMTVLVDYFGQETSDAVAVCRRFPDLAADGRLAFRMDTPGGRYCEGLDRRALLRGAGAQRAASDPRLSHRGGAAPSGRHRRHGGGDLAYARGAERGRVPEGQDRRELRVRSREMPHDGGRQRADRRDRHRLLSAAICGPRPTRPPTSSPMTASRWSRPAANSCCVSKSLAQSRRVTGPSNPGFAAHAGADRLAQLAHLGPGIGFEPGQPLRHGRDGERGPA